MREWHGVINGEMYLPSRSVLITYNYGDRNFLTHGWPLLKRYGFSATVFLVANHVERQKALDHRYGEEISFLTWEEIRQLQAEGVTFGSHSVNYHKLTLLPIKDVFMEFKRSLEILESELKVPVSAFAYPYGIYNRLIQFLVEVAGYSYGLTCEPCQCTIEHSLLALPHLQIEDSDSLMTFVQKLDHSTCEKE